MDRQDSHGISFTDGTPVNADAVIDNLQRSGTGLLIAAAVNDIAKVPDPGGATNEDGTPKMVLKIEKADDSTFTIFTGKGGDPAQPLSWPGFDFYLTGQLGLIASPTWLAAVDTDPTLATAPVGSGPFIVQSCTTRRPGRHQEPQLLAEGRQRRRIAVPRQDHVQGHRGRHDDRSGAAQWRHRHLLDVGAAVISDFRDDADFPMSEQTDFVETNYLLIDMNKGGPYADARRCVLSKAIDRQDSTT